MSELESKVCFKCQIEKQLSEFYKHSAMTDGHLNKCKECAKKDSKERIQKNYEKVIAYDKQRANLPHRVEQRKNYRKRPEVKEQAKKRSRTYATEGRKYYKREHYLNNKERYKKATISRRKKFPYLKPAYIAVQIAVNNGSLKKENCVVCGNIKSQAHHEDYTKPLDVVWYCKRHHMDRHIELRDAGFVWDELGRQVLKETTC